MGGVSAAVSKTAAAPIERIKLLVQNQVCAIALARDAVLGLGFRIAVAASAINALNPATSVTCQSSCRLRLLSDLVADGHAG